MARSTRASDPGTSLLGDPQERWLFAGLRDSPARWNVLAQQTIMAQVDDDLGLSVRVTPKLWHTDYEVVTSAADTADPAVADSSWVVENGRPGAQSA